MMERSKKIYDFLKQAGYLVNRFSKERQSKGNSHWENASKWLSKTKFPKWPQKQNLGSINEYLEREIQSKPDEAIFDEQEITFRDLYVPLKVRSLDASGYPIHNTDCIELERWSKETLNDKSKAQKILFIQADAGRGKSVFCRMFADWVRKNWHTKQNSQLSFTPILIKLRHLKVLENSLTKTFENYLETYEFVKNPSWLTDQNIRFLFFLDGFDELLLEGRASGGVKELLQQVEHFQQSSHHRFIVTGRPLALQGIDRLITQTKSLERVEIQQMDNSIRQTWLEKWAVKVGAEEAYDFREFLNSCPTDVQNNLAREPLLLYLLARMHREQHINAQMFAEAKGLKAKVRIYDMSVDWVLHKQRQNENQRLTGLDDEDDLRSSLNEAALCVVQSGNESAKVAMLVSQLVDKNNPIAEAIQKARQEVTDEKRFFNNLLTSFYLNPASDDKEGSVEFAHKSFSEFLFAERLKKSILNWTSIKLNKRQSTEYWISNNEMNRQIYNLLGYGNLTLEIVNYLMALLIEDQEFKPINLFERLENFYFGWCNGEFIDAVTEPQSKMLALKSQMPEREVPLGMRQVDMYTGLNVMILLLELHRHAQSQEDLKGNIVFHPCRTEDSFDLEQLLRIIGCSHCISTTAFIEITRSFLSEANLSKANLHNANLSEANLRKANLSKANLRNTNLRKADLSNADLSNADLSYTDLRSANLSKANLSKANLSKADLSKANLSDADLSNANLSHVNLRKANLSNANFNDADLRNANLSYANLTKTDFSNANFGKADLSNADLRNTNLSNADLSNADLIDGTKNLTLEQVKQAKNWQQGIYNPEFQKKLVQSGKKN